MYLALFLFPWVAMYASSTLVMNHRAVFVARYGEGPIPYERERQLAYDGDFPEDADLRTVSAQILTSVGLDGAHNVTRQRDGKIVITRNNLTTPRRLTDSPVDRSLVIERQQPRSNAFLERFHRRRGYATGYRLDTLWAVTVDAFILGTLFWVLSGLWMWWEMKVTRHFGLAAIASGAVLFALYLVKL